MLKEIKFILRFILIVVSLSFLAFTFNTDDKVVAEFGKFTITLDEYKIAYLNVIKNPRVFDSKQLREEFLDEMIINRLLADEARKQKYNQSELFKYKTDSYFNKCLRDAHFETVIKSRVKITEEEIEEAYLFTQEERRISHLFAETKEKADSLYKLLKEGKNFESVAKELFKDSSLANKGGDLGWVNWDQLDYDLSLAAFRLPPHKISEPIKSQFGYHIIKVTDYKKKPLITRSEYELHRRKAKALLQFKLGDKYAFEFLDTLVKKAEITIYPNMLKFVQEKLANQFKRKPTQLDQMNEIQLNDSEVEKVRMNLWDARNETMAEINGEKFTIGDFISGLNFIPYEIVYGSFKKTVDIAFRDFLITHEAKMLELDKSDFVKLKSNLYAEFLLQIELRKKMVRETNATETELLNYYYEYKKEWKAVPFEEMKSFIKETVINKKRRETIPSFAKEQFAKLGVKKNLKLIHEYYDLILEKKG